MRFSLPLAAIDISSFRGIINSITHYIGFLDSSQGLPLPVTKKTYARSPCVHSSLCRAVAARTGERAGGVSLTGLRSRISRSPVARRICPVRRALVDFGADAGADGAPALANGELGADLHSDGLDQLDGHLDVIAGHDHLDAFGQADGPGDIGGADVELGPIAVEEGGMAPALFFGEDIDLGLELLVGFDGAGFGQDLAALDLVALHAAQQDADVVAGHAGIQGFLEHLDAGDDDGAGLFLHADDLHAIADLDLAALDASGAHGAASLDAKDILNGHEEGLVDG